MYKKLNFLKGMMFPAENEPGFNGGLPPLRRSLKPRAKRFARLEDGAFDSDVEPTEVTRINSFYKAPIGEENFSIKHIKLRKLQRTEGNEERQNRDDVKRLMFEERVKPENSRFVTNVLSNHDRTQHEI